MGPVIRVRWTVCLILLVIAGVLGPACDGSQPSANASAVASPSPAPSLSPYFDSSPTVLVSDFAQGIGNLACTTSALVFTDGPLSTLYVSPLQPFRPRTLLKTPDKIGTISAVGSWAAFATYRQAGDQLSPLAAWTVYAVDLEAGRVIKLASGTGATELSELPQPTIGNGYVVWDELMGSGHRVLWHYDLASGTRSPVSLPTDMSPVGPFAAGDQVLFLDNNRDPNHATEVWISRGGQPVLVNLTTGAIARLSAGGVAFQATLALSRAIWFADMGSSFDLQQAILQSGEVSSVAHAASPTRLWANDEITIWLAGDRGAVTARLGNRTAIVSPDLTISPGGLGLCGSNVYYGGPNLSLRVAHLA